MLFMLSHQDVVDLTNRTCTCGFFQSMGLPCKHAMACIDERSLEAVEYCEKWYCASTYRSTYEEVVFPTLDRSQWGNYGVLFKCEPPRLEAPKKGRRKTKRIESQPDPPARPRAKCGNCREVGHNRTKCTKSPVPKEHRTRRKRKLPQQGKLSTNETADVRSSGLPQPPPFFT